MYRRCGPPEVVLDPSVALTAASHSEELVQRKCCFVYSFGHLRCCCNLYAPIQAPTKQHVYSRKGVGNSEYCPKYI